MKYAAAAAASLAGMGLLSGCAGARGSAGDAAGSSTSSASAATSASAAASSASASAASASGAAAGGTLIVLFSRAGQNYSSTASSGVVETTVGNTQVMAQFIQDQLGCDLFQIQPADAYPDSYYETCDIAKKELSDEARPQIANMADAPDLSGYGTILVGAPIWWGSLPRIMMTYLESQDFSGKTIIPFTTSAGSGLGSAVSDCTSACKGATVDSADAFTQEGEDIAKKEDAVRSWAKGLGLNG